MTGIMSIRSGAPAPPLDQDRAGDASTSPPTEDAEAALPLPRQLLVSLAGTAADITSLRQRFVDDPQLQEPLDRILGKLDDVVDSIYQRAADAAAHPTRATAGSAASDERRRTRA